MTIEIKRDCELCNGTGEIIKTTPSGGSTTAPCEACSGTGKLPYLISDDLETKLNELEDKVNDVMDKSNDIFEKVNE